MNFATGKVIAEFVDNLDFLSAPFDEHQVSGAVNSFIKEKNLENLPFEWLAEAMTFDFVQNYSNRETGWDTYYGPTWVMPNGDGTATESPGIRLVTPEIIDYWEQRSRTAKHPILRLRYADLVWDFSKTVAQKTPHFSIAHIVIESTIEVARGRSHKFETDMITKLERALSLAIQINDTQRVERLRDAIIEYEDCIAEDNKAGLWGLSFDLLLNRKVPISNGIKGKLIKDLEDRLARLADPEHKENLDPWAAEGAALRLAKYYRSAGQNEDAKHVLLKFGTAFEVASKSAAPPQASAWLQHVHSVYLECDGLSVCHIKKEIKDVTCRKNLALPKEAVIAKLNETVRGWANYFYYGNCSKSFVHLKNYMEERVRMYMRHKHRLNSRGYGRYPNDHLYKILGLYKIPITAPWAQAAKVSGRR